MTTKELTELMVKQLLKEWKQTYSTTLAYEICNTLCEYYKISEDGQRHKAVERGKDNE